MTTRIPKPVAWVCLAAVLAANGGCRDRGGPEPFEVGVPGDYAEPGVYLGYAASQRVALVNNNGMLVALSMVAPHSGRTVRYDAGMEQFIDASGGDRYSSDGLPLGEPSGRAALERCRIDLAIALDGLPRRVLVDPRTRLRFEDNQWSDGRGYVDVPKALAEAEAAARAARE